MTVWRDTCCYYCDNPVVKRWTGIELSVILQRILQCEYRSESTLLLLITKYNGEKVTTLAEDDVDVVVGRVAERCGSIDKLLSDPLGLQCFLVS